MGGRHLAYDGSPHVCVLANEPSSECYSEPDNHCWVREVPMRSILKSIRKMLGRITGIYTPLGGLSWSPAKDTNTSITRKLRADAFVLGTVLITNINAVSERPRRISHVQQLWSLMTGLLRNLGLPPPDIPGKQNIIDADIALKETMLLVQSVREAISARNDGSVASAFWLGVTSMLAAQFLQNPALVSMATPLLDEVRIVAAECSVPSSIVSSYLANLQSGNPQKVRNAIMPFTTAVTKALSRLG